jgi:DUF4097 and DUF4098 domain-containing protein YvlB
MRTIGCSVLAAAGLCLGQLTQVPPLGQLPPLTREGDVWASAIHGAFPCGVRGQLKVSTSGDIVIRGVARDDCGYRIRQKVQAASESEARFLARGFTARAKVIVDTSILTIVPAESSAASLELEVWIPRTMREATLMTRSGRVVATDFDGSVSVDSGGGPIEIDRIGGNGTAQTVGGKIKIGRVTGSVRCFSGGGYIRVDHAGGETWVDTAGGEISIGQVLGPLHVTTAGGNIEIDRAASQVWARSMSGLIDIQEAGGSVNAIARGGSIQIGSAKGGANCEASSGAIRVKMTEGPMRLSTLMGNVLAQLTTGRAFADSLVNSDSGDVTVLIPQEFPVSVLATNQTPGNRGMIVSEFPQIRIVKGGGPMYPVRAEGSLNGGGPVLRVSTGRGSIYLLRQK